MDKQTLLSSIQKKFEAEGYRLTPQRTSVVKVLLENRHAHPSAEEIYLQTKTIYPDIGLTTVYRSLELLEKLNIVYKLDYGDGQSRYELGSNTGEHYHHHLICLECGEISEFKGDLLESIEQQITEDTEFKIADHCLRFFGYCKNCQAKKLSEAGLTKDKG